MNKGTGAYHSRQKLGVHSRTSCAAHHRGYPQRNQTLACGSNLVGDMTDNPVMNKREKKNAEKKKKKKIYKNKRGMRF